MNSGRRRPGDIAWALSSPFEDAASTQAAHHILKAPKPDELLDLVFPILMDQKTIRFAFNHLERAGADLTKLSFSTKTVLRTAPLVHRRLWPIYKSARWPASDLAHKLTTHRQHLWQATYDLHTTLNKTNFLLLSGRAMEATYPTYHGRLGFDVDLWFPSIPEALEALEALVTTHNFTLKYASIDNPTEHPHLSSGATKIVDGYDINVGIITGAYHAGRYRRSRRPFRGSYSEDLEPRSIEVICDGRALRSPSSEDLLLMVAARVRRSSRVQLVNTADAAIIAAAPVVPDASLIDSLSRQYGLEVELGVLLASVERRWPSKLPESLRVLLSAAPGFHRRIAAASTRTAGFNSMRRMAAWTLETSDIRSAHGSGWTPAATRWLIGEAAVQARRRARRKPAAAQDKIPLCGVADNRLTHRQTCVAHTPANLWRQLAHPETRTAVDQLYSLLRSDDHDCRRLWATGIEVDRSLTNRVV